MWLVLEKSLALNLKRRLKNTKKAQEKKQKQVSLQPYDPENLQSLVESMVSSAPYLELSSTHLKVSSIYFVVSSLISDKFFLGR